MVDWQDPRQWDTGANLTRDVLNLELRNKFLWLKSRNLSYDVLENPQVIGSSGSWTAVDDTYFSFDYETYGGIVVLGLSLNVISNSAADRQLDLDWLINDTNYLSSGTGTPNTRGSYSYILDANLFRQLEWITIVPDIPAGVNNFKLRYKVNLNGLQIAEYTNCRNVFWAMELGD